MTEEAEKGASLRRSERFVVSWPSRILLPDGRILAARTKDVSEGGVGFELDEALPVGTQISMELSPWVAGKQQVIRAKCAVTYNMILAGNSGFSHGVKFTAIPNEYAETLKSVLKSLK